MSKRRFEFVEGHSAKFWEIAVDDREVTVTFGRIGTAGQTQVKSYDDGGEANRQATKLIAAKTKKGYAEVSPENAAT